uniref:Phospholipase A2 domain-containing protein n=1 Tax=Chromulina nebulosa TaxID=96789 RepID=A0A7S0XDF8_9STRA|mmetsp:Transcript_3201/g.2852  ORF Transcript_3201/g.2852 Transcript_3201/m.2852 type:complete len:106 (+) Transcript_3201:61-378(+)
MLVLIVLTLLINSAICWHNCGEGWKSNLAATLYAPIDVWKFDSCCQSHDICYEKQNGKSLCDNQFKNCMISKCDEETCELNAQAFYTAVRDFGDSAYKQASTGEL